MCFNGLTCCRDRGGAGEVVEILWRSSKKINDEMDGGGKEGGPPILSWGARGLMEPLSVMQNQKN